MGGCIGCEGNRVLHQAKQARVHGMRLLSQLPTGMHFLRQLSELVGVREYHSAQRP